LRFQNQIRMSMNKTPSRPLHAPEGLWFDRR